MGCRFLRICNSKRQYSIARLLCVDTRFFGPLVGNLDNKVNQLNQLIELTRSELKRDDRQRIMSLITMDAHARDIVLMLIREGVTNKVRFDSSYAAFFLFRFALHHRHILWRIFGRDADLDLLLDRGLPFVLRCCFPPG